MMQTAEMSNGVAVGELVDSAESILRLMMIRSLSLAARADLQR